MYDICNTDSYKVSIEMLQEIKSDADRAKVYLQIMQTVCVLVGNQTDRETERQVTQQEAELTA